MDWRGLRVRYDEAGTGPLVVLFHGWGASADLFRPLSKVIATQYHVVSPDFPGCGGTAEPSEPWGMDEYTAFAAAFIASFGADEVVVLGHSHGGRVAIRLATDPGLPFTIKKLILVDSAGLIPRRSWKYHARVKAYKAGKAVLKAAPVKALAPRALAGFQRALGSTDYAAASPVMRASLVKVVNTDLAPLLPKITASTLLIWGEDDQDTPLSAGRTMEASIPGSGLVVLPRAGHYSFLDQPYTFARVIESFLEIGG